MTDVFSALSGSGDVLLPSARFVPLIGVEVTTLPPGYAVMDLTVPRRVMKVGWVSPGRVGSDPSWPASLFFEDARWIDFERELMTYPAPGVYCDRIRYHIEPGGVATLYVNDTGVPAVPNSLRMPWDRAPSAVIHHVGAAVLGPTALTTGFTYTVPNGKRLLVSNVQLDMERYAAATVNAGCALTLLIGGGIAFSQWFHDNNPGSQVRGGGATPDLVLSPGEVITGKYQNFDTGGYVAISLGCSGTLFDY